MSIHNIGRLFLLVSILTLSGCNYIDVEDGRIPDEYLSTAQNYVGEYTGSIENLSGKLEAKSLRLSLVDGRAILEVLYGEDVLDFHCGSEIGRLLKFRAKSEDNSYSLKNAIFDFEPKNCDSQIEGNTIELEFISSNQFNLKIVKWSIHESELGKCHPEVGGGVVCEPDTYSTKYKYLKGNFQRR